MQRLFDAFAAAGRELYLVGGGGARPRDGPLDGRSRRPRLRDELQAQETLKIIRDARLRTYTMGIEFGTVGAVLTGKKKDGYPKDVQITTYRSSEYYRRGSRHPVVQFGDSIEQDLARRDFSINSVAMDAERNFVDPHDGLGDIERRTLRVISDPYETLAEDPLRILRVARFMARLGFTPTDDLQRAAHAKATWLLDISQQRWIQELTKILKGPYVRDALEFLLKIRALGVVLPEVVVLVGLHDRSPGPPHDDMWERTLQLVPPPAMTPSSAGPVFCSTPGEPGPVRTETRRTTHPSPVPCTTAWTLMRRR